MSGKTRFLNKSTVSIAPGAKQVSIVTIAGELIGDAIVEMNKGTR
jgi:hypothetical protein